MSLTAVFDCMIFLQAVVSDRGPAIACFDLAEAGEVTLLVSPAVLEEVRDVLSRPKLRAKFATLTTERVDAFLQRVAAIAKVVPDVHGSTRIPATPTMSLISIWL